MNESAAISHSWSIAAEASLDGVDYGKPASAVEALTEAVDAALATLDIPDAPEALYEPVRYVLAGQGKRLRPVFLILAADAFGAPPAAALPAALAVEVFHNFTLVHDDIMDHADARRGRPTVHVRWDRDTAILCGDYLLALSYDLLARSQAERLPRLMQAFSLMVTHLCEGQTLDKAFETDDAVTVEQYLHMIDRKTGALLRTVLDLGGLLGTAIDAQRDALRSVGANAGRAFQIQDDLLDLVADGDRWGKTVGGDLIEGKKTFLLLQALERADGPERAWFMRVVREQGLPPKEIPEARDRMQHLGVLDAARDAVARYSEAAMDALDTLPDHPALQTLRWLIQRLQARHH